MSVVPLDKPTVDSVQTIVRDRPAVRPSPAPRTMPQREERASVVERRRTELNALGTLAARGLLGATAAFVTFSASSLCGQVMVDIARQDGIKAHGRAVEARKAEVAIQQRLNSLVSAQNIEKWATLHHFTPPDAATKPVAREKASAPTL